MYTYIDVVCSNLRFLCAIIKVKFSKIHISRANGGKGSISYEPQEKFTQEKQ